MVKLLSQKGSMHLLLAVLLFFLTMSGFGVWSISRRWRHLVETQLRLNQCVGQVALQLRDSLNTLALANQRIYQVRLAMVAAVAEPSLLPALKTALQALVVQQEVAQIRWKVARARWLLPKACGNQPDLGLPLPGIPVTREVADILGPRPLRWTGQMPSVFYVRRLHSPRATSARIEGGSYGNPGETAKWRATWTQSWAK
jgi:hypothetical protein